MQPGEGSARSRPILTSLPLQIFVYFGGWWDVLFWVLSILVFVYKGFTLPYPPTKFAAEFVVQWLFLIVEPTRLFLGSKGNKTEQSGPLMFSVLLACPMIAFFVYFLQYQTYILKVEVLLNAISLAFCCIQVLFGTLAAVRFVQAARYA